jgi:hypothetical protein
MKLVAKGRKLAFACSISSLLVQDILDRFDGRGGEAAPRE